MENEYFDIDEIMLIGFDTDGWHGCWGEREEEGDQVAKTNRRYYWIQLAQDFFKSKEMKLLRKMPGGDTYTIIYLKLMLISLEDSGKIYFEELAQDLAEEMALLIDEDTEAVRMTLMFIE